MDQVFDETQFGVRLNFIGDGDWIGPTWVLTGNLPEESICLGYMEMCAARDLLNKAIEAAQLHKLDS